jgi:hypothetical protein
MTWARGLGVAAFAVIAAAVGVAGGVGWALIVSVWMLVMIGLMWRVRYGGDAIRNWSRSQFDDSEHWSKRRGTFFDR